MHGATLGFLRLFYGAKLELYEEIFADTGRAFCEIWKLHFSEVLVSVWLLGVGRCWRFLCSCDECRCFLKAWSFSLLINQVLQSVRLMTEADVET